ncbi:MAG: hypothetical protein JSS58_09890 [Proteobacteria bacterium]|nr:hypothetical protein [Pseudomonadota bacterium]
MSNSHILATKLVIPDISPQLVQRARLMSPPHASRLILVSAPAGYGKTTLLVAWARELSTPVVWLSLDSGDNDPRRFLMNFIGAIQTQCPEFDLAIPDMLGGKPLAQIGEMMQSLINHLCSLPGRLCIILDDLHMVSEPAVHQALAFLTENQPPQLQLIFSSRSDPPFSLARLRGQRQLVEYRAHDLCFTSEEAEIFCNDVMQLDLQQQQVAALTARTEGWIVGLQLAAVSMQVTPDKSGFIDNFSGDNRHVTDFLLDEVLRSRSAELQDFLLQTSLFGRFDAAMCDAVTGRDDSRRMIDEMERTNMFIVSLDHQRIWYRYHHLFASLLQSRFRNAQPEREKTLYRRASQWCDKNDLLIESIDYAIRGDDFLGAADLMEKHGNKLFSLGQISTVLNLAKNLPQSLLAQRPALLMMCAWGSFYLSDMVAMESHIRAVANCIEGFEHAPCGSAERAMFGQLSLMRGCRLAYNGDIDGSMTQLREALVSLPPDRTLHRGAAVYLGVIDVVIGELDQAQVLFEPHTSIAAFKHNVLVPITATFGLARVHLLRGNLAGARQVYNKAIREAQAANVHKLPAFGMLYIGMGELAYQMNALDEAQQYLERGVEMTAVGMEYVNTWGRILLAQTRMVAGAADAALDIRTETLLDHYAGGRFVIDLPPLSAAIGRLWLGQNRIEALAHWVELTQLSIAAPLATGRDAEYLVLARFFLQTKRMDKAIALLDVMQPSADLGGRRAVLIEIGILKALALQLQGDMNGALVALQHSVALAENTQLLRLFIDDGIALSGLLTKLARASDCATHAHYLLGLIVTASAATDVMGKTALPSLFSKKEKEIVTYIVKGNSNQEIGKALFISSNTVYSHMKSIYAKLGVNSRLQAIKRLRELQIDC